MSYQIVNDRTSQNCNRGRPANEKARNIKVWQWITRGAKMKLSSKVEENDIYRRNNFDLRGVVGVVGAVVGE